MTHGDNATPTTDASPPERIATALGRETALHDPVPSAPYKAIGPDAPSPRRNGLRHIARVSATALCLPIAVLATLVIWDAYVTAPWTRDARVRAQVADIAPQISGQITEVRVVDNQFVHKGEVLYVIEPFDFRVALATATAQLKQRAADLQVKRKQSERRLHLTDLATTAEEQQVYAGQATDAEALFEVAEQQQAQAEINLARTEVRSPVNGFVTNLLMRVGDYARAGVTNVYVIDTDSYWIDGYFEETKLARLCVGDRVEARLLGFQKPVVGRIDTITRGISVSDATPSTQGLPGVNAIYTWVRLAQRVPVRIHITQVPPNVPLIAGLTATVVDREGESDANGSFFAKSYERIIDAVQDVFDPPFRGQGCIPRTTGGSGPSAMISAPTAPTEVSPNEINPGLAPGLNVRPSIP